MWIGSNSGDSREGVAHNIDKNNPMQAKRAEVKSVVLWGKRMGWKGNNLAHFLGIFIDLDIRVEP
jgi:hypothetical protein